jgi:hypothetical protein
MNEWNHEAEDLIRETERFIAETEIAMFVRAELLKNEELKGNEYYKGFKEAMVLVLEYIHEMTRQRKILKEHMSADVEIIL